MFNYIKIVRIIGSVVVKEVKISRNDLTFSFTSYIKKMRGETNREKAVNHIDTVISAVGGLIAISIISLVAFAFGYPAIIAPIAASCVLIFGAHKGAFSQPRQIIGGHVISSVLAIILLHTIGNHSYASTGLTLAVTLIVMGFTKTLHPPAAASAIVAMHSGANWHYLVCIICCSILLVLISILYNNLFKHRQYPQYWV